jgi:hypothetical protein
MLQAAHLAEQDGADDALVAAALLHDVGHFTGAVTGQQLMAGTGNRDSVGGADWLARWFGPAKDPGATTPHFDHFRRLLVGLVRPGVKK